MAASSAMWNATAGETATVEDTLTGSGVREGYIAHAKPGLACSDTRRPFCLPRFGWQATGSIDTLGVM